MSRPKRRTALVFTLALSLTAAAHAATVAKPSFNKAHGFYTATFSVQMSTATSGARIRYTTDGSRPTTTHGIDAASGASISIGTTTVLRACAYKSGMTTSTSFTQTYIFLNDVIHQTRPSDYPTVWGTTSADYEMDPVVVNDSRYNSTIKTDLKSIPTLSVVIPKNDLFGATGIYHTGGGAGGENVKEVAGSMELIYPDGRTGCQINCGVKSHSWRVLKRAFRLLFKTNYGGPQKLEFPFFEEAANHAGSQAGSYGKIFLRCGLNRSWTATGSWREYVEKDTYTRDQWARDSLIDMCGIGGRGLYVHLYLNGLYWGVYNPSERTDARYGADYFGGGKSDWFAANHEIDPANDRTIISGNRSRYDYLHNTLMGQNMANASVYDNVKKYLDVEQFSDYLILSWYCGKGDWPKNNFYCLQRTSPGGGLMYSDWDSEDSWVQTVASWNGESRSHTGAWIHPAFYLNPSHGHYNGSIPKLMRKLDDNVDFRTTFADRVYKHCYNSGALTEANAKGRWNRLCNKIERAMVGESARWGDVCQEAGLGPLYTLDNHWKPARDWTRNNMTGNVGRFITALRNNLVKLYPDFQPPALNKYGGTVAAGFKLTMTGSTGTIYYRTDGEDPRVSGGGIRSGSSSKTSPVVVTLNATTTVRARIKKGATWSALADAKFTVTGGTPPPAAPGSLAAAALDTSRIQLTWSDNSSNESGFKIDRRQSGTDPWVRVQTTAANIESWTDPGLPAETTFYYKVKAFNAGGNSAYSNVDGATTESDAVPAIAVSTTSIEISVDEGQNAASVTFQVWNSGTGTLQYNITETTSWFSIAPTSGASTGSANKQTHTITFTTADKPVGTQTKTITVADNASGASNGPITITVPITVNALPPDAPGSTAASALSASEILVAWQDNSDDEDGFKVDRRQSGTTTWVPVRTAAANIESWTDSGLPAETMFYYKVKAYNATGDSDYSNVAGATTESDAVPAIAVSTTSIEISVDEGQNAASVTFQVWNSGTGTLQYNITETTSWFSIAPTSGASTGSANKQTHTITFTTADKPVISQTKTITIADNASGASNGPITITVPITVNALPPDAPGSTAASALSASQILVAWQDNSDDEDGFKVDRRQSGTAPWVRVQTTAADVASFTDSGLPAETTFYYKVMAHNAAGDSDYSNTAGATTTSQTPAAPSALAADAVSASQIALTWTDNASNEEIYKVYRSPDGATSWIRVDPTGGLPPDTTAFSDTGLEPETTYFYKVRCQNVAGNSDYCSTANATTPARLDAFAAYNDLAWFSGQLNTHITTHGRGQSGNLVDYVTGATLEPTLTVTGGAVAQQSQGANPAAGTDAYATFNGKVDCAGCIGYATEDLVLALDGLDPSLTYELVLYADRNNPDYAGANARYIQATLSGADTFANDSSTGATRSTLNTTDDTTTYNAGYNNPGGLVARFTAIAPGADGQIVLTLKRDSASALYTYANALMLRTVIPTESSEKIAKGDSWRYRKGQSEASAPRAAWRTLQFDDTGWSTGPCPLGYGRTGLGTDLTDMRYSYSCVFLRKTFTVETPGLVNQIDLDADHDDGFILWINGQEVARVNVNGLPGEEPNHTDFAASNLSASWSTSLTQAKLPPLGEGQNVAAVQLFNRSLDSGDLLFDLALTVQEGSVLAAQDDTDADGMDDDWENANITGGDADPNGDQDQDGLSNLDEFIAGTDPEQGSSYLAVDVDVLAGQILVSFATVEAAGTGYEGLDRYYALEQRLITDGAFNSVPGLERLLGQGQTVTHTNDVPAAPKCYRARVWLE